MRIPILSRALRGIHFVLLALLATAAATPRAASAQPSPADSAAILLDVATGFESQGERDVAEALYRHIADRFPGTPAAEAALARLGARSESGGETELKVWSTLYGLWLGVAVPMAMDAEGSEAYGVGLLLGGPLGYLGGRALTRSRPVSLGQARAITWGGTWGAWQGMSLASALDLGGGERIIEGDIQIHEEESSQAVAGSMIGGGAVGILGGVLASRREISPGTATSAMLGSLWGAWFGFAGAYLLDFDEDPTWGAVIVTGNAGLVAGALAGSRWPLSRSRARLISVAGVIGGFGGLGLVLIAQPSSDKVKIGIPLVGSIAGLGRRGIYERGRWHGGDGRRLRSGWAHAAVRCASELDGRPVLPVGAASRASLGSHGPARRSARDDLEDSAVERAVLLDFEEDPTWGTVMVTGNAGLVAGALAGSRWPLSRSRARGARTVFGHLRSSASRA